MMSWPTVSAILLLVFTHSGTQFDAVGPGYRLAPGSYMYIALKV